MLMIKKDRNWSMSGSKIDFAEYLTNALSVSWSLRVLMANKNDAIKTFIRL